MLKHLVIFFISFDLFADCNATTDLTTGEYSSFCASSYLGLVETEYLFLMGLSGAFLGALLFGVVSYATLRIGKSWKI